MITLLFGWFFCMKWSDKPHFSTLKYAIIDYLKYGQGLWWRSQNNDDLNFPLFHKFILTKRQYMIGSRTHYYYILHTVKNRIRSLNYSPGSSSVSTYIIERVIVRLSFIPQYRFHLISTLLKEKKNANKKNDHRVLIICITKYFL